MSDQVELWFRIAKTYGAPIEAREIIKATDKTVFFMTKGFSLVGEAPDVRRKETKHSRDHSWYPTFTEAKVALIECYEGRLEHTLEKVRNLKNKISRAEVSTETQCIDKMKGIR